jgi:hypothetical protein
MKAKPFCYLYKLLTRGELWFGSANAFNDPFDTAITYNFEGYDSSIAEEYIRDLINNRGENLSQHEKDLYISKYLNDFKQPGCIATLNEVLVRQQYNNYGICSLSATNDNLLLWAHYCLNHTGVCIGIDVQTIMNFSDSLSKSNDHIDIIPVIYKDKMPKANYFEAMRNPDNHNHFIEFIGTKSSHWSYEQETRLIYFKHAHSTINFGTSLVKELILGCKTDPKIKKALLKIHKYKFPHVRIYEAKKDTESFKLDFAELS